MSEPTADLSRTMKVSGKHTLTDVSTQPPRQIIFEELDAQVAALSRNLRAKLPMGARVGIIGNNSIEWVRAFYGAMRAGMVAVPISSRFPASVIEHAVRECNISLLMVDPEFEHLAPRNVALVALDSELHEFEIKANIAADSGGPPGCAMILLTSGSTSLPKPVLLSHAAHEWVVRVGTETRAEGSRLLISAPLFHMGALSPLMRALGGGQDIVLMPKFDADRIWDVIDSHDVTDLNLVPTMAAMMLQSPQSQKSAATSVRRVILNSAPASETLLDHIDERFESPHIVLTYGTTETGPVTFYTKDEVRRPPAGSIGLRHPAVKLRLAAAGESTPSRGELQINSPAIMLGYGGAAGGKEPVSKDGFYRTGDVFEVDHDGYYYYLGRNDDMFVSGGNNIYPRAVEAALEQHPAVEQAVVIPVPDELKNFKPVAYVTLANGASVSPEELKDFCLSLMEPASHPRRITIMEALPLAGTNKIDRTELAARALADMDMP